MWGAYYCSVFQLGLCEWGFPLCLITGEAEYVVSEMYLDYKALNQYPNWRGNMKNKGNFNMNYPWIVSSHVSFFKIHASVTFYCFLF